MKLGVCLAVLTCVALLASTTGVAASEDTPPSAATQAYLAALGPAGAQITRAEAELRALPATATPRQVNKIVATVASKLEANAHHAIVWLNPKAKRTLSPMPLTWRRLGPH